VVVAAIAGTAGIGKTALAVHWAHRVADRFPDGQLYVNLRGFDPSGSPMAPAEAVRGFLDGLQVPPQGIPASLEAQAGLYRSLLAGRRMLVLLDNARDAGQVAPLLPGAPGCLVLVTSRNQLPGLVAAAGAHPVALDLLSRDEAVQLLARRLGDDRLTAEPDATDELVTWCAGLPLALAIVAARVATHPAFPLAVLADQLREARDGLDGFDAGDTTTDARAVFSWSYRALSAPAARLFRLLGLHPGADVTTGAAASLAGLPPAHVRPMLAELASAHLVTEHTPGRYAFHDLLRAYAGELAHTMDTGTDRWAATRRLLDHYLHIAHAADLLLYRHGETITLPPPEPAVAAAHLGDYDQAMAWFTAEHRVLLAAIDHAARTGSTATPASWPGRCSSSSTGRGTGTTVPPSSMPPWTPRGGWATATPRPGRTATSASHTPTWVASTMQTSTSVAPSSCPARSATPPGRPGRTTTATLCMGCKAATPTRSTPRNGLCACSRPPATGSGRRSRSPTSAGTTVGSATTSRPWRSAPAH
jgi:hypothetical protein